MKIVADIDIPFLEGVFEPYGEVAYKKGDQIVREDVLDADVLIVRTRTQCNAESVMGTHTSSRSRSSVGICSSNHVVRRVSPSH